MTPVFADTSYWFAVMNPTDQWHQAAVRADAAIGDRRIVTTEMVLTELLNSVSRMGPTQRDIVATAVRGMYTDPRVTVLPQTAERFQRALDLYETRLDKRWGHTDCASFLAMRENDINQVLTFDRDFAQAGFTILM